MLMVHVYIPEDMQVIKTAEFLYLKRQMNTFVCFSPCDIHFYFLELVLSPNSNKNDIILIYKED